jgi:hypothetical protein
MNHCETMTDATPLRASAQHPGGTDAPLSATPPLRLLACRKR